MSRILPQMRLPWRKKLRVGIALGGGGVRGRAHIPVLQVLDDMGITPACVAGTSMGAIIGVLYCGGMTAAEIREELLGAGQRRLRFPRLLKGHELLKWLQFVLPDLDGRSLFRADKFLDYLFQRIQSFRFEELKIPLQVVAADFWAREPVVFRSGDLLTAVQASMAVPGVFAPVLRDGRLLVDGGMVNPVPWDILTGDCDMTIAVEVTGRRITSRKDRPSITELLFNTYETAEQNLNRLKKSLSPPDIYVAPELTNIGMLEFHKVDQVFRQTESACAQLRKDLEKLL